MQLSVTTSILCRKQAWGCMLRQCGTYEVNATKYLCPVRDWLYKKYHSLHSNGDFKFRSERKTQVNTKWFVNGWQVNNNSHLI